MTYGKKEHQDHALETARRLRPGKVWAINWAGEVSAIIGPNLTLCLAYYPRCGKLFEDLWQAFTVRTGDGIYSGQLYSSSFESAEAALAHLEELNGGPL